MDRLANLYRARGCDGVIALVCLETLGRPFQFAKFEDSSDLCLTIRHELLVVEVVNPVAKHFMPVIHQPVILDVVLQGIFKIIRIFIEITE